MTAYGGCKHGEATGRWEVTHCMPRAQLPHTWRVNMEKRKCVDTTGRMKKCKYQLISQKEKKKKKKF